jgi:hypothetical protein
MRGVRVVLAVVLVIAVLVAQGCFEAYCQSGAKHGTQCHSRAELEADQRAQGRQEPPSESVWLPPSLGGIAALRLTLVR